MHPVERQSLVVRIDDLNAQIARAREELERAESDLYQPRIRELEEQLVDTRRQLVDMRKSIAASARRRWQRWPVGTLVLAVLCVIAMVECR
jgi:chromosome segregation ATPase